MHENEFEYVLLIMEGILSTHQWVKHQTEDLAILVALLYTYNFAYQLSSIFVVPNKTSAPAGGVALKTLNYFTNT